MRCAGGARPRQHGGRRAHGCSKGRSAIAIITALCVYCGSQEGRDKRHAEAARRLGEALAKRNITLVYGGGGIGLMAVLADAVLAGGGRVVGVLPRHFVTSELLPAGSSRFGDRSEILITDTMHRRKQEMFERSDGFVMLPGGFGTLDEFFEVLTWRQIGLHDKPIIVIDDDGYWEPLLGLLDHLVAQGFTSRRAREGVVVVRTIEELFQALDRAPEPKSKTLLTPF